MASSKPQESSNIIRGIKNSKTEFWIYINSHENTEQSSANMMLSPHQVSGCSCAVLFYGSSTSSCRKIIKQGTDLRRHSLHKFTVWDRKVTNDAGSYRTAKQTSSQLPEMGCCSSQSSDKLSINALNGKQNPSCYTSFKLQTTQQRCNCLRQCIRL